MIESVVIINPNGICIYNANFSISKIDEQLLSGFLIAVNNFSKEVMSQESELQTIDAKEKKIVAYEDKDNKLTIAAIANPLDQDSLLLKVLKKILDEFYENYHEVLDDPKINSYTRKFNSLVKEIINPYVSTRGKKQFILSLIAGTFVVFALFFLQINFVLTSTVQFINTLSSTPISDIGLILVDIAFYVLQLEAVAFLCFAPAGLITGYIAGSRKKGLYIGIILNVVIFIVVVILIIIGVILSIRSGGLVFNLYIVYVIGLAVLIITFIPLNLVTSFAFSYIGGYLKDKRKLYPIPPEKG